MVGGWVGWRLVGGGGWVARGACTGTHEQTAHSTPPLPPPPSFFSPWCSPFFCTGCPPKTCPPTARRSARAGRAARRPRRPAEHTARSPSPSRTRPPGPSGRQRWTPPAARSRPGKGEVRAVGRQLCWQCPRRSSAAPHPLARPQWPTPNRVPPGRTRDTGRGWARGRHRRRSRPWPWRRPPAGRGGCWAGRAGESRPSRPPGHASSIPRRWPVWGWRWGGAWRG